MRQVVTLCTFLWVVHGSVDLYAAPRSFLTIAGGAQVFTAETGGDVFDQRTVGQFELGIGTQIGDDFLLEGSFGLYGNQEGPFIPIFDLDHLLLPESQRTFRLEVNPIMLRLRYARSGMRAGYLKPELHAGIGIYSVTRWLQPIPGVEPDTARDLLLAGEAGLSALFILGKNFMATVGSRFSLTQRRDLVDQVNHLDGFGFLLGFRFFLNSPRDEAGS